ncbi:MAG: LacI family DNA-binding transcriptional regulator, partial [Pseudomonadota bacterium]
MHGGDSSQVLLVTSYMIRLTSPMKKAFERKKANLRDVARNAQVSVATVSRVLNSPDVVKPDTRQRVEAAIEELGFFRSAAARAINTGRTKIVGALIPSLDNDIFALTIDAMEDRLADFGFSLVVATTEEDPDKEARKAKELLDIGVEGLFVPGVTHSEELYAIMRRFRVPTVVISYYDPSFEIPTIGYDNHEAARIAMQHLLDLGHRKILVVHGPTENNDRTRERLAGSRTDRHDVELSFVLTELSVAGGCNAVIECQNQHKEIDAYLCVSDVLAFGVIFELQRLGYKVPFDVSVMGIHNLPSAPSLSPSLSTVDLPARKMGQRAAEALAIWVEDDIVPESVCFETCLV